MWLTNPIIRIIDWLSEHSGQFVAFWTINAVFAYAFEVIARYIFNKPTIWVHESSFLLFGMQYLLAGAYAYLHGSHVAVDIVYNKFPKRGQYGLDIFHFDLFLYLLYYPDGYFLRLHDGLDRDAGTDHGNLADPVLPGQNNDGNRRHTDHARHYFQALQGH
jgi:hypothetical protein